MSDNCDEQTIQQLSPRAVKEERVYQNFSSMRLRKDDVENFDKTDELKKAVKENSRIAAQNAKFDSDSNAILRAFDYTLEEYDTTAVAQMQLLIERLAAIAENAFGGKTGRRKRQAVYDKVMFYLAQNNVTDQINNLSRSLIYGLIDYCVEAKKKSLLKVYAEIKKLFV